MVFHLQSLRHPPVPTHSLTASLWLLVACLLPKAVGPACLVPWKWTQCLPEAQTESIPRKSGVPFALALTPHTWLFRKHQCEPGSASVVRGYSLCQNHVGALCQAKCWSGTMCLPYPQQSLKPKFGTQLPGEGGILVCLPEVAFCGPGLLSVGARESGEEPSSLGNPLPTGLFPWRPPTR